MTMFSHPFVTVIVPLYNDSELLRYCLSSLCLQTYPQERYEVIVVDNGSDENIQPLIKEFSDIKFFKEERPGSYSARNSGILHANGEILAFTDSDCNPSRDWIEKGVTTLINTSGCGVIGGRIRLFFKKEFKPTAVEIFDAITFFQQKLYITKANFSVTANLFTFKKVFEKVGLFNEKLVSGGDVEWCHRVYSSGLYLGYAHNATVNHPARHSYSQMIKKVIRVTKGQFSFDIHNDELVKKFADILRKDLIPPVNRIRKIWVCSHIKGHLKKAKVILVLLSMKYLVLVEKLGLLTTARFR